MTDAEKLRDLADAINDNHALPFAAGQLCRRVADEIGRLRAYEQELADAASVLHAALPVGEVKAIGLREVAAGCRLLVNEVGRLRVDNEKLAKQVCEWIENFPEAGGEE